MRIKWLGHASFLITSDSGIRIITDPYAPGRGLNYGEIKEAADIVTVSHEHGDHSNIAAVQGRPAVVKGAVTKEIKGIKFQGIPTHHDQSSGKERGDNTVFCFEVDGLRVCHAGDLGHQLTDKQVADLGKVDILLVPAGGLYTIDAQVATELGTKLAPKVIIPMHYRNEKCTFPISGVDDFLKGKARVIRLNASETEFQRAKLSAITQIVVLQSAL